MKKLAIATGVLFLFVTGMMISVQCTASPTATPTAPVPVSEMASFLPDPAITTGVRDGVVYQNNLQSTICVSGYTATVRPPVSVTDAIKIRQMLEYHRSGTLADYEEDHLIPLELGGAPANEQNLWPEPWNGVYGAHVKDQVENEAHRRVCNGRLALLDAQAGMAYNWIAFGRSMGVIR